MTHQVKTIIIRIKKSVLEKTLFILKNPFLHCA